MMIIVKSMIYLVIAGNGLRSTLAIAVILAWVGEAITTIALATQLFAAPALRAIPVATSHSGLSFM